MSSEKPKNQTSSDGNEVKVHVNSSGVQHVDSESFSENPKVQETLRKFFPPETQNKKKEK